jgi:hypothetical protein
VISLCTSIPSLDHRVVVVIVDVDPRFPEETPGCYCGWHSPQRRYNKLSNHNQLRVCNSEDYWDNDTDPVERGICRPPEFDYLEVRIKCQVRRVFLALDTTRMVVRHSISLSHITYYSST